MAMRRPRIKPLANILSNSKRKAKPANDVKDGERDVNVVRSEGDVLNSLPSQKETKISDNINISAEVVAEIYIDTTAKGNNQNANSNERSKNDASGVDCQAFEENAKVENIENVKKTAAMEVEQVEEEQNLKNVAKVAEDSIAFKCPPKVVVQRTISHTSNSGIDDVFYTDIEQNALQMDSEKSPSNTCTTSSPSKNLARQRIRPTPHFGQRRNSFVGSSPSTQPLGNDDNHAITNNVINVLSPTTQAKRERHYSASFTGNSPSSVYSHHHNTHKYLPAGITSSNMGRIRTESGCSVFSDSNVSTQKVRKSDDHKQNHRKDFEARFYNGVPGKDAIKMSDLIYYNPATNPMEQKPHPSQISEPAEISSEDTKQLSEEVKKNEVTSNDSEDVLVPQLKLNAKGELILDDKSLVIETTAEQEARKVLANTSLIYLDEYTGMSGFYSRRRRTRQWVPAETIKFYRCLQSIGTDFSLMVSLFPNRTRRDLKLKFKKEERKNNLLISKALVHPKLFDIEALKQQLKEEEQLKNEQAEEVKKKPKRKRKDYNAKSKADRVLIYGDIYDNEIESDPKKVCRTNVKSNDENVQNGEGDLVTPHDSSEIVLSQELTQNKSKIKVKQKKIKKGNKILNKDQITAITNTDDNISNVHSKEEDTFDNQERRRTSSNLQNDDLIDDGSIKIENKSEPIQTSDSAEFQDANELQTEIDELLEPDAVDMQSGNAPYETLSANVFDDTSQIEQFNTTPDIVVENIPQQYSQKGEKDTDEYQHSTFLNFNDETVNVVNNIKDDIIFIASPASPTNTSRSQSPASPTQSVIYSIGNESEDNSANSDIYINNDTCSSVISEPELSESDIQSILTELAEGRLVLVSTLDPDDPDKVLNEIYMVDKNTGELCDEPLSVPDSIVQCILTVVS